MKKITMILSLALLVLSASAFAQTKGETQFNIGGGFSSAKSTGGGDAANTLITAASVRYLMQDKIGLDVGLGLSAYDYGSRGDLGIDLSIGGNYYYYSQGKLRLDGGIDLGFGFGKGRETTDDKGKKISVPISIAITPVELEYWPMEGGAFTASGSYTLGNITGGDAGVNVFGVALGVKIRLK